VESAGVSQFAAITDPAAIRLPQWTTTVSFKQHVFPRTEAVLNYQPGPVRTVPVDPATVAVPTVAFGLRPCDAAGLIVLREMFGQDPVDPYIMNRLDQTIIVSVGCRELGPVCFCLACGYSPAGIDGSDVLLMPLGDGTYRVDAATSRGTALIAAHPGLFGQDPGQTREELEQQIRQRTRDLDDFTGIGDKLLARFSDPGWDEHALRCLGCAMCAYLCPTCHCFNLVDEGDLRHGERRRTWDACGIGEFTLHASGHNPRPDQPSRYRQRLLHKFSYYPANHDGRIMCVGCGRCITHCPVTVDIREIAAAMSQPVAGSEAANHG